jgi:hypothetical protein
VAYRYLTGMLRLPPGGAAARRAAAKLEGPAQIRRGRQLLQDEPVLHVLRVMPIELDGRKPICELGDFCVSIGETPHCRPGKHEQKPDDGRAVASAIVVSLGAEIASASVA